MSSLTLHTRLVDAARTVTEPATAHQVAEALSGLVTAELAAKEDRILLAETALTRARELHRPVHHTTPGGPWCNECTHPKQAPTGVPWPCPTICALNNITPPRRRPTPRKPPPQPARLPGPLPTRQALQAGLAWLHTIPQPPTALINHQGLPLRTTTNRTLRFVPARGRALVVIDVHTLTWKDNGEELTPTDHIGPTELNDLTTLLATLGAKVTSTWNGHPTITGTLALARHPHPTLTKAANRYRTGCPHHPERKTLCTCGWYEHGRAQLLHPTTESTTR